MRRLSTAVALVAVCGGACAQTVDPVVPKCVMWNPIFRAEYPTPSFLPPNWNRDEGQFEQMAHFFLAPWEADLSGEHWGERAAREVLLRIDQNKLSSTHVVLHIGAPGYRVMPDPAPNDPNVDYPWSSSFFVPEDAIIAPDEWPGDAREFGWLRSIPGCFTASPRSKGGWNNSRPLTTRTAIQPTEPRQRRRRSCSTRRAASMAGHSIR